MRRLFPFVAVLQAKAYEKLFGSLGNMFRSKSRKCPAAQKFSTGHVPREWNIRDAWIKNAAGERIVDFKKLNLHVVSYSTPIKRRMRFAELKEHLFTIADHPDWVPYRTSYYKESWGFCLSENQLGQFNEADEYDVCIDSSLQDGSLTYGEYLLKGAEMEEVLISCHVCHPSLANDNLSGISLAVELAKFMAEAPRRYSYRFLFIPGTIGSITWLARNETVVPQIRHGLVLTCVGDAGNVTYKRSRRGNAEIDRAFTHILQHSGAPHRIIDFFPYGYDERQYCSPGFNLPVGVMMRSPHGEFPQYHTSADNLEFVRPEALEDSFTKLRGVIDVLEQNRVYLNLQPKGEPQLGRRGLYGMVGGENKKDWEMAILWVLNLSDGNSNLLDIAERSGLPFSVIHSAADALVRCDLLKEIAIEHS